MISTRSPTAVIDDAGSRYVATSFASTGTRDVAALVGRILLAVMFVVSGFGKITGFDGTVGYIASKGLPVPALLAAAAIAIELGGGLAILAGWMTRWVAVAFMLFLVVITPIFHNFWAAPEAQHAMQQINFMKNVSILGGFLILFAFGPGRYSIDRG
ncbi:MAG TPA: DoxX family protein [Casimicrobiaceae bacterium]|nr:DoxX family protein [Casimicrobiaceae bacterium]